MCAERAHLIKLSGKKGVIAVIHGHDGVVSELAAQFFKKQRRVHAIVDVTMPISAISIFVAGDAGFHFEPPRSLPALVITGGPCLKTGEKLRHNQT